jgi:hypothetical protein
MAVLFSEKRISALVDHPEIDKGRLKMPVEDDVLAYG